MLSLSLQCNREISQTRGKTKEHIQEYLPCIFTDCNFESSGRISDTNVKESRAKALAELAVNDRFIWEPPEYQKNEKGELQKDEDDKPIVIRNARDPFTGPYLRNTLRYLFLEESAKWKKLPRDKFTIPQIAFVCTLVSVIVYKYNICLFRDISGYYNDIIH